MKQSPLWAVTLTTVTKSPNTKCFSGKGGHHCSSGCGSNTSTLKCPDSTSVKKSSSSKEPVPKEQDKSPRSHSSHKHGCSPSPSAKSDRSKLKEAHTEDTCELNSTLSISSSGFDGFRSPTGSHSKATKLHPSSITSTLLGLGTPQKWQSALEESWHLLALLYTSPGFNLPGQLVAGLGNPMPSIPSLTGSHQVSNTWPTSIFTPVPSSPHLTIDQANRLAAECQALGIKLAKKFQVLLGLEAMHHNSIQGMVHETLTLGCSAWEATYFAIIWDRVPDDKCKATTCHLHSEANVTWKEMHEVMYNHQLHYNGQLAMFLVDAETALSKMRGEVWDVIHALAESEGITFDVCLGRALQMLNLLLQIPIDISFYMQIPLTITYCPESSINRKWHSEQGGILPLRKVLGGVTHQPSVSVGRPPSPTPSDNSVGSSGSWGSRPRARSQAQSITHACS